MLFFCSFFFFFFHGGGDDSRRMIFFLLPSKLMRHAGGLGAADLYSSLLMTPPPVVKTPAPRSSFSSFPSPARSKRDGDLLPSPFHTYSPLFFPYFPRRIEGLALRRGYSFFLSTEDGGEREIIFDEGAEALRFFFFFFLTRRKRRRRGRRGRTDAFFLFVAQADFFGEWRRFSSFPCFSAEK